MAISRKERDDRKERVLEEAFRLFTEKSIESVSMQDIADSTGIGVASVFRYYANKADLAVSVGAYVWDRYNKRVAEMRPIGDIGKFNGIERLEFALDSCIDMYRNYKDILIFNENLNHFIMHEEVGEEKLAEYRRAIGPMDDRLHRLYEKGKEDGTLRSDIPEGEFKRATVHSMMATCQHYAGGFIWGAEKEGHDYTTELLLLKEMIMKYVGGPVLSH